MKISKINGANIMDHGLIGKRNGGLLFLPPFQ